jgi:hypothetical protein
LQNRANFYEEKLIHFEEIYAIDDAGDEWAKFPHVYLDWDVNRPSTELIQSLEHYIPEVRNPDRQDRIKFFPDTFPEPRPNPPIAIPD